MHTFRRCKLTLGEAQPAHLYFSGSCLRMSKTVEIAYSPVSSVSSSTRDALPEPDTAAKACTLQRFISGIPKLDGRRKVMQVTEVEAKTQPEQHVWWMRFAKMQLSWWHMIDRHTLRMFLRKPRIDVTLIQPMKASTMYCTASSGLNKTGVSDVCLGIVNNSLGVERPRGILEP